MNPPDPHAASNTPSPDNAPVRHPTAVDELCYPFIYETSHLCDYDILTNELCQRIGDILAHLPADFPELHDELNTLQPLIWHLNGSIRGKLAITTQDLDWLLNCYRKHRARTREAIDGFVLPRGAPPVGALNLANSSCKKIIRIMLTLKREEGIKVPAILFRFVNVLCNYLFTCTLVINQQRGSEEVPFISKSYPHHA